LQFTNDLFTPYAELGFQYSNYFDFFLGGSYFSWSNTFTTNYSVSIAAYNRAFTDQFTFTSQGDDNTWAEQFPHYQTNYFTTVSTSGAPYYFIYPMGRADGSGRPNRSFSLRLDPNVSPTAGNEYFQNTLDVSGIEFKLGGRSWVPLYGMGRIGTTLGALITPMPYKFISTSTITALATNAAAGLTAGQTVMVSSNSQNDIWCAYGLSCGVDLELGSGNFLVRGSGEYNIYFTQNTFDAQRIVAIVNPSGGSLSLSVGGRF
ncbi:MAG: hypothetical protein V2B18_16985, partial [Pseudomonadota bacterium]